MKFLIRNSTFIIIILSIIATYTIPASVLYYPGNENYKWYQWFTYPFVHANTWHLIVNMISFFTIANALDNFTHIISIRIILISIIVSIVLGGLFQILFSNYAITGASVYILCLYGILAALRCSNDRTDIIYITILLVLSVLSLLSIIPDLPYMAHYAHIVGIVLGINVGIHIKTKRINANIR